MDNFLIAICSFAIANGLIIYMIYLTLKKPDDSFLIRERNRFRAIMQLYNVTDATVDDVLSGYTNHWELRNANKRAKNALKRKRIKI